MSIHARYLLSIVALASAACAPLSGASSTTVLAASTPPSTRVIGEPVEERSCSNWLLTLFYWGDGDGHEALVARALERTKADALVDAEATTSSHGVPYIYMRDCSTVRGRPARFAGG